MPKLDDQTIQLIIIAIAGVAVVAQAFILFAIFLGLKKAAVKVDAQIAELRKAILPVVVDSYDFVTRVAPRIEATSIDVAELVHGLRVRTADMELTAAEALDRLNRQTVRMDAMLTAVLDSLDRLGGLISVTVNKPARQLAGVVAAVKAAVVVLRRPSSHTADNNSVDHKTPIF
jgi:hypothetical protein